MLRNPSSPGKYPSIIACTSNAILNLSHTDATAVYTAVHSAPSPPVWMVYIHVPNLLPYPDMQIENDPQLHR